MTLKQKERAILPTFSFRAGMQPESLDEKNKRVELVWSTGKKGIRAPFFGEPYYEELSMDPSACRLGRLQSGNAPLLNSHQSMELDHVIGVVESARIENGQGIAVVRFSDTEDCKEIWEKVRTGIIKNVSIGYAVYKYERQPLVDGEEVPTYLAVDWEPNEISMVPVGFDENAVTRSAEKLIDCVVTEKQGEKRMTEAEQKLALEKAKQEEKARCIEIRSLFSKVGLPSELADSAIKEDKTIDEVRALVIDELARKQVEVKASVSVSGGQAANKETRNAAIENSIINRASPNEKLTEDAREFRGMSLIEIAKEVLASEGKAVRGLSKNEVAIRAMHVSSDFPSILANVANKSLRKGYEEAPRSFLPWAKEASAPDFKQMSRTQLGEAPLLDQVVEGGEITKGTMSDGKEVYSLLTYAKQLTISRQAIINDDLNAFSNMPSKFGFSAACKESDVVYAILTANAAMADGVALFHATHKNLGAAGAISQTTLGEMRKLLRKQTGMGATRILNLMGKYLIVPAALETVAEQYLALLVPQQASNVNPFSGKFDLIVEPRLDASSATAYYLAAAPGMIDTVEYCYLEGQRGVYTESQIDFDTDGFSIKARLDFAAKALDHRGMVKNAGA